MFGSLPDRVAPAGHSLLFAVGAGPPHDGVRRARRLNLSHDFAGVSLQARDSQRDRLAHRPHGNDPVFAFSGKFADGPPIVQAPASATPHLASCRSGTRRPLHMRWRMTASLRATATRARAMPRCIPRAYAPAVGRLPLCAPGHDPAAHPLNPAPLSAAAWPQPVAGGGEVARHRQVCSLLGLLSPAIKPQPQPAARDRIGRLRAPDP